MWKVLDIKILSLASADGLRYADSGGGTAGARPFSPIAESRPVGFRHRRKELMIKMISNKVILG